MKPMSDTPAEVRQLDEPKRRSQLMSTIPTASRPDKEPFQVDLQEIGSSFLTIRSNWGNHAMSDFQRQLNLYIRDPGILFMGAIALFGVGLTAWEGKRAALALI